MVLSRFWYVLLGLFLGLSVFLLSIATSMYNRAGARAMGEALSSDSQVVAWYLRDDARQRSGRLIQFGVDPDIAKYLQKSSDSEAKVPEDAREKLLSALKKVNAAIPKDEQFDAVFAVDQAGRVVARLGYEQASGLADFELGGYPVVADALRGYVRDDTLILDRIYRVVARPVEFDMGSLPAGAIIGARIVDDRFARELSSRTGAAIAFYANGERASSGAPEGFATGNLDQIVGDMSSLEQDTEYKDKGRSKVRTIGGMLGVQYSRLPGEAWQLGGGFAVARLPVAVDGPFGFFKTADDKGQATGQPADRDRGGDRGGRDRHAVLRARAHAADRHLQERGATLGQGRNRSAAAEPLPRRVPQDRLRSERRHGSGDGQGRWTAPRSSGHEAGAG